MFDENIKFKYSWRPYQEEVLKKARVYLQDGKVNVVAAPGSGKTVLGLELVRELNQPVLILAPTITIKNQWVDRFVSLFTNFSAVPDYISTNIYDLKFFNVATYQALHYAYRKRAYSEEIDNTDDKQFEKEIKIDSDVIKSYDLIEELKAKKIKTLVLDEAHHLKSQWWNSLTKVVEALSDVKIVSLTATPPYDSDYTIWKKYISLCGNIDAEITVPELVAANNLCPHQDFVYFNMPTEEENIKIHEYNEKLKVFTEKLCKNQEFIQVIQNHRYVKSPQRYEEELLDNVEFYSSMLIFLNSVSVAIPRENITILGSDTKIPNLDLEWLQILLKNVIITCRKDFVEKSSVIENIERELQMLGIIEKNDISFTNNQILEKYFLNSMGKLKSISQIVKLEHDNLKDDLKMVILTDYIRKEYLEQKDMELKKLGVFPIFIKLANEYSNIDMAILTGTFFIIPRSKEQNLFGLCFEHGVDTTKLKFTPLVINENYSIVDVPDNMRNKVMSLISKLFSAGQIKIIIGTKSLLGEGWDEPSINTLVLASFVGSFMLSNQMRGRAIRTNDNPRKTANIWHLVCVTEINQNEIIKNADYALLERRFNAFVGIGYFNTNIRNGLERLGGVVKEPFNAQNISKINKLMEEMAVKRDDMYDRWKDAMVVVPSTHSSMIDKTELKENEKISKNWVITKKFIIECLLQALFLLLFLIHPSCFTAILNVIIFPFLLMDIMKIFKFNKKEYTFMKMGEVLLNALYRCDYIKTNPSKVRVKTEPKENGSVACFITGTTLQESKIFIDSLEEIFYHLYLL